MTWLAVVAVLFSVIGAYYYLRIVKLMYFDKPEDTSPIQPALDMRVAMSANGLAVFALGVYPSALTALCVAALK
jgi:NADH-quinone oxidoreductase subunit N